jgi:hypothetical protein
MKYALLVYTDPSSFAALSEEEAAKVSEQYFAVREEAGFIAGEQLEATQMATTVRVDEGRALVTDGPFADTKEVLGGFYLFEAENLDRAIELASKVPSTWMGGSVEIRPLAERSS